MNVLYITQWYPTKTMPAKGIFIKEHKIALESVGHRVFFLHFNIESSKKLFKYRAVKNWESNEMVINLWTFLYKGFLKLPFLQQLIVNYYYKKIIKVFNVDLIHSNVLYSAGLIGLKLSKKYSKPLVITEHMSGIDQYLAKNPGKCKVLSASTYITVVSNFLKEVIYKHTHSQNITVVPNVVNSKIFYYKQKPPLNSRPVKFLAVATWNRTKRVIKLPEIIIEVLKRINDDTKMNIELEMVGEGNMIPMLKELASACNFHIKFSGRQNKEYISSALHRSDFYLHASTIETFSVSIAEAIFTGTPVIASKTGAIPELVSDEIGILTENNIEDWVEAIKQALNRSFDHLKISESYKNKFSYQAIGERFTEVYNACTNT